MNPTPYPLSKLIDVPDLSPWSPSQPPKKHKVGDAVKEKSRRKMAKKSRRINRGH